MHPCAVHHIACELPAGRINILPSGFTDGRGQTCRHQSLRKCLDLLGRRTQQPRGRERIERNQIELAPVCPAGILSQQTGKLLGLFHAVIDTVEHAVLQGDEIARCVRQITFAGAQQLRQRIFEVERHQLVA